MAKIVVQFHGLPTEVLEFAENCTGQFQVRAALIQFFPEMRVFEVIDGEFQSAIGNLEVVNMIAFSISHFDLPAKNMSEFMERNPDSLMLKIGALKNDGLVESVLSANTGDPVSLSVWKKVVKKLHEHTCEGAWAVNRETGVAGYSKKHRYTVASKELEENGTRMLPIAGWNFFVLGKQRPSIIHR